MTCPQCNTTGSAPSAAFCAACGWQFYASGAPMEYASFGRRAAALAIDFALLMVVAFPLAVFLAPPQPWERALAEAGPAAVQLDPRVQIRMFVRLSLVATLVYFFYAVAQVLWTRSGLGATPGKYWLGLQVVAEGGRKPGWGQLIGRQLLWIASIVPFYAGFWWVLIDPKRQTFHDRLAGTWVVKRPAAAEPPPLPRAATAGGR